MRVLGYHDRSGKNHFCDKRCHTSTKRQCNCACQGLLHGRGEVFAEANSRSAVAYLIKSGRGPQPVWLNPELVQAPWD